MKSYIFDSNHRNFVWLFPIEILEKIFSSDKDKIKSKDLTLIWWALINFYFHLWNDKQREKNLKR